MFERIKNLVKRRNGNVISVFSESVLKTSFYEELQKNGWCDIITDSPDDLIEYVNIKKIAKR